MTKPGAVTNQVLGRSMVDDIGKLDAFLCRKKGNQIDGPLDAFPQIKWPLFQFELAGLDTGKSLNGKYLSDINGL